MKNIIFLLKISIFIILIAFILSDIVYSNYYPIYSIIILSLLLMYYVISPKIR